MNIKTVCLIALAALIFGSGALLRAEDKQADQMKMFDIMDGKKDGKVTQDEFVIFVLYQIFQEYDTNHDKRLSKAEFLKGCAHTPEGKNAEAEWAMMDSNGTGTITFKDALKNKNAVAEMQAEFKKLDKQGNGYITSKDIL